ncbi:MAG: polysaccharide biosynthesis/export family protein [Bacteroidetes bacterium]|nr:polysaccharide biosynthesis/export family protein [Bacteroidota bacterium]
MRSILILLIALSLGSCKVFRSNFMFVTPRSFKYDKLIDSLGQKDYIISPNDILLYKVLTNDGFKLIDMASTGNNNTTRTDIDAVVSSDGTIKLPLIGQVSVNGLTVKQAESLFEEKFSKYYVNPYVNIKVNNRRVIVFPGNSGIAKVVTLSNNNTTVLEALATAGGITEDGKAYKVKLFRNNPNSAQKPLVYLMDLSKITGLAMANTKVQNSDVIYIEPRYKALRTFALEIAPVLTLLTTSLLLYQYARFR